MVRSSRKEEIGPPGTQDQGHKNSGPAKPFDREKISFSGQ
jgi:hypothetical protein